MATGGPEIASSGERWHQRVGGNQQDICVAYNDVYSLLSLCVDVSLRQFMQRLTERMAQSHVPQSDKFQNVVFELVYTTSQLNFYIYIDCVDSLKQ